jgi:hypothetical protein
MTKLPDNARLGLTLYFKSPSLGQITFIDVDASPEDGGEVELLPQGIAELSRRWCATLNRTHKVRDFRPAIRKEVVAYVQRHDSVDRRCAAAKPAWHSTSAASAPGMASASGVRHKLGELGSRYFGMPQRALAALRSRPVPGARTATRVRTKMGFAHGHE